MELKEFTERDMNNLKHLAGITAENRLLKQILEQKLEIELSPKRAELNAA